MKAPDNLKQYHEDKYQEYLSNQRRTMGNWNDPKYKKDHEHLGYCHQHYLVDDNNKQIANYQHKKYCYQYNQIDNSTQGQDKKYRKANKLTNFKNTGVIYQVLVYNFCDGNNDGIGDFIGLKNKLDYIDQLGVDQIWLSPIHSSSSYHGYDVINYCDVAEQLGGMNAFIEFLDQAHQRGIKVYLDMVFNHTSYEHPWFQKALAGDQYYRSFYRFVDTKIDDDIKQDDQFIRDKYPVGNKVPTGEHYLARFWQGMPDLNLDNSNVINELIEIQKFWTAIGVDGFRYDAIGEYFSSEIETKNNFDEIKIFSLLRKASKDITKDNKTFMFGEWIFTDPLKALKYCNKESLNTIYDGYKHWTNTPDIRTTYDELLNLVNHYHKKNANWIPLLNNHDTRRWLDVYREEVLNYHDERIHEPLTQDQLDALKLAIFNMLATPSFPIIYAGDELGYYGSRNYGDPGLREPIKWKDSKQNCFFVDDKTNSNKNHVLLTQSNSLDCAEELINKDNSIYKLIQFICGLRKLNPLINKTDPKTIIDPELVVDSKDYSSIIVRKDYQNPNKLYMFAYCNYRYKNLELLKISRDFYFKPLFLYKAKNNSWNIEIQQNGFVVFELLKK
ncbi:alpha-amylase family glycosyl hydrolase [Mycoplasma bradburyae]|uniref:Alpha-amylase n=1 Tax=Mycoplasma bradburyae TaxID=2963128 RepID=A0AAW6HPH9_9MOLU|nr:alpha-amylase family glycosyl hydrolase [Mycoplasma bradburyae]MDC4183737.1 alpha-amylase [Mycoplasma bradburyae]UTS70788.1 alpha-amylase family glycosyl hydrolase [Mycoplasma bradburyae]